LVPPLPPPLHQESSGICTSLKEGALRRGGSLSPVTMAIRLAGMLLASIPAERCVLSSPRRQALHLSEQKLPLTPHATLQRAVSCPSASRSPQPKPRLQRPPCTLPSGKRPKESDRRLPWEARGASVSSDPKPGTVLLSPSPPYQKRACQIPVREGERGSFGFWRD